MLRVIALALVAILSVGGALAALTFPPLTGRVTDAANIISPETRASLDRKLADLEDKSSIQLVVATVPSLQDTDVETYANGLFRAWKLGEAKRNNGVLLVVAPNERKVRVEVGYGLEGTITDALSAVIIQSAILPRFKAGDFSGGIDRGVDALISAMTDDQSDWHKKVRVRREADADGFDAFIPFLVFALFLFIVFMQTRNARRGLARRGPGGVIFIPSGGSPWSGGSSSGGGSSWGGGGGGFDGGGFSGGGGSSGGGGASGSW